MRTLQVFGDSSGTHRSFVSCAALGLAALGSSTAGAQEGNATESGSAPVQEVTITGSRISRPGFDAPTPTTSIGIEEIQKAAPANIADFVNQLPQLSANATPRVGNANTSTGFNGLNNLNLRSLGANRTLVLLDGRRVISSALNGAVDINNLPSALVEQVDVVTGGASAAYGSDAVSGVVNFVLNKQFTGLKANVSTGVTSRGDDENTNAEVSFGTRIRGRPRPSPLQRRLQPGRWHRLSRSLRATVVPLDRHAHVLLQHAAPAHRGRERQHAHGRAGRRHHQHGIAGNTSSAWVARQCRSSLARRQIHFSWSAATPGSRAMRSRWTLPSSVARRLGASATI